MGWACSYITLLINTIIHNIKVDLREVGGGGDWMELAQDRDR